MRLCALLGALAWPGGPAAAAALGDPWPAPETLAGVSGDPVTFPTRSPFGLGDVAHEPLGSTTAIATLFLPRNAALANRVPAVVTVHGSAIVLEAREMTCGRQLASMGVAVLVVDTFATRRDRATSFLDRLMEITETMMLADAYAGLHYLAGRGDVDTDRVVLAGFSYGGMATTFAAFAQVAELLAPTGPRFAGHVAFYGPCLARFKRKAATGAPLLALSGSEDAIVNADRCREVADDLRQGGATVESIVYQDAYHQWDGSRPGPRMIGRNIANCSLHVHEDNVVQDRRTTLTMTSALNRKLILAFCADGEGYLIGRDDAVRARSNADFGRFLAQVFRRP